MTLHPLLRAFRSHTPAFGAWLLLPSPSSARTVALASRHLSWVLIDCEHGLTSLQPGASEVVQAIHGIGEGAPSALIRVPATGASDSTSWQIKYALDAGARGVLVPMVSPFSRASLPVVSFEVRLSACLCEGIYRSPGSWDCCRQQISTCGTPRSRQSIRPLSLGNEPS